MSNNVPLESQYTSYGGKHLVSNYVSADQRNTPHFDLFNQTHEFSKNNETLENEDLINTQRITHEEQQEDEPKVELYQLIQENKLVTKTKSFEKQPDRVITKNLQTQGMVREERPHTYTVTTKTTQEAQRNSEKPVHDLTSKPVSRTKVLSNLTSKPVKRSFTNGLRIFRKVKDSQGNIVKENMEQSINIYSNKILNTMNPKRYDSKTQLISPLTNLEYSSKTEVIKSQNSKHDPVRNYKTHLYTSSTLNTPVNTQGLISERNIANFRSTNPRTTNLYHSSRNIEEAKKYSQPRQVGERELTTSIFYSGTKTENNSARNSNVKTHYVRSTRVSPAITLGNRSVSYYRKGVMGGGNLLGQGNEKQVVNGNGTSEYSFRTKQ
jgi:hypothetical protein